ncbi:DNA-binding protein [Bacteroidia bacterium]|nr:DNA-binding protein [Bacteroidia bacterium]
METLCKIRDIYRAIAEFETVFQQQYGICLNEGMLICSLQKSGQCSSGEIASMLGLTCSNASKVICLAEKKNLIVRTLGDNDKRQMYFALTEKGAKLLATIQNAELPISESLKTLINIK